MIKRYYNKFMVFMGDLLKLNTMESYEKYLLKNLGKKTRFRYRENDSGMYRLYFNANKGDRWMQVSSFIYDNPNNTCHRFDKHFYMTEIGKYIESHSMIDDIYNDFKGDADYIRKEIQRKKDYDRSHNIYN